MNALQRPLHGASFSMTAHGLFGEAVSENDRAINGPNNFQCGNLLRLARQPIATVGPVLRNQKAALSQFLKELRKDGERNPTRVRDFFGAHRSAFLLLLQCKMSESNQTVIRLLCKSKHREARSKAYCEDLLARVLLFYNMVWRAGGREISIAKSRAYKVSKALNCPARGRPVAGLRNSCCMLDLITP